MKKILLLSLVLPSLAFAFSWTMEERDGHFFVRDRDDAKLLHAMTYTGKPRIVQVLSNQPPLDIIEYNAGTVGTSTLIKNVRRIIFHREEKRFIGDYLYSRELVGKDELEVEKPKWEFFPDKKEIVIKDSFDGEEKTTVVKY